jgi:hypothetical protein
MGVASIRAVTSPVAGLIEWTNACADGAAVKVCEPTAMTEMLHDFAERAAAKRGR